MRFTPTSASKAFAHLHIRSHTYDFAYCHTSSHVYCGVHRPPPTDCVNKSAANAQMAKYYKTKQNKKKKIKIIP